MKKNWNRKDMPDQSGKTVLVTGANAGVGYNLMIAFVQKGARVIMACRNMKKAESARADVLKLYPNAEIDIVMCDLGNLDSVRRCAETLLETYSRIDIYMCNAGIMAPPLSRTENGFEMQMGVNHFGHFALLGRLMPLIKRSPGGRIVTTSSFAEKLGTMNIDTTVTENNYNKWICYGDSKLAVIMLAFSLDEKLRKNGIDAVALSAHPGVAKSHLRKTQPQESLSLLDRMIISLYNAMAMPTERGALPLLYAATDPDARGGQYIGVTGPFEMRGKPKIVKAQKRAYDKTLRERLWEHSENRTGVSFGL
ncbi:MAG: oxidoreductase [Spirochaetota bacterium]